MRGDRAIWITTFLVAVGSVVSAHAGDTAPPLAPMPKTPPPPAAKPADDCPRGSAPKVEQARTCVASAEGAKQLADNQAKEAQSKQQAATNQVTSADADLQRAKDEAAKPGAKQPDAKKAVDAAQTALDAAKKNLTEATTAKDTAEKAAKDAEDHLTAVRALLATAQANADPKPVFAANGCADPHVLCLLRDGSALGDETIAKVASVGDVYTVKIFVTVEQRSKEESATVSFVQRKSLDVLFGDGTSLTKKEQTALRSAGNTPSNPDAIIFDNMFVSPAVDDGANEFVIVVTQTKAEKAQGAKSILLSVEHGHSYYSVAFLVATTYRGERVVHRDLSTTDNATIESGFALNVFPGGRRRGVIGYIRDCNGWRRCLADTLGLQFGTDVDLSNPFDRVFGGLVFEPVAGLAFSAGLSVREEAFIRPESDLPGLLMGTDMIPVQQHRVIRPYLGITITFDLLDTLAKVKEPTRSGS